MSRPLGPGVSISESAFHQLVARAVEEVDGARLKKPRKSVEPTDGRIELVLTARFGAVLPELARDVQRSVTDAVEAMCGLKLAGVDVTIEELDG